MTGGPGGGQGGRGRQARGVGPGALCARPPSRNHMIQKNAKEAGWEVPSRKTKHWDGSLAQHMLATSQGLAVASEEVSALQLAVAWRTHWLSSRKADGTTEPSQCRHIL